MSELMKRAGRMVDEFWARRSLPGGSLAQDGMVSIDQPTRAEIDTARAMLIAGGMSPRDAYEVFPEGKWWNAP